MRLKIRMDGLKGLSRALKAAPKQVSARLDKAMAKNADEFAASARALAPVGPTGDLKESIGVEHKDGTHYVEATDDAAPYVEWGRRDPPQEAQPFFFVAYRSQKKRFRGRNARAIRQGLKDAGLDPKEVLKK